MSTESTETTVMSEDFNTSSTSTNVADKPLVVGAKSVYKDVESLIEGKKQADAFIEKLKAENQALFEQLKVQTNLNNFKKEMLMTDINDTPTVTETTNPFTEEQIRDIALKSFESRQAELSRQSSLKKADEILEAMYGSEAKIKKENKAKELGMTVEQLDEMCMSTPKAFNKLMGIEEPTRVSFSSIQSTLNTNQIQSKAADTRVQQLVTDPSFAKNSTAVAGLIEDALKNPSILRDITEWKVLVK